jgi:hypothetical protein
MFELHQSVLIPGLSLSVATEFRIILSHRYNSPVYRFGRFEPSDWVTVMLICFYLKVKHGSNKEREQD